MLARAIFVLAVGGFATITSLRGADPLLIMIGAEYGISPASASSAITAIVLGYGAAQFVHGPLGDRLGKFHLMAVAAAAAAVASFACALSATLPALNVARFCAGAMTGAMVPLSMAWIGDVVPYDKRQAMLARYVLGNWAGLSFGALTSGVLAEHFGWRAIFWVLGVVYVILAAALWLEMRTNALTRRPADAPASLRAAYAKIGSVLSERWPRILLSVVLVDGILLFSPLAFIPLHAQSRFGMGTGGGAAMMLAMAVGGFTYAMKAGPLVGRFGEGGLLGIGGVLLSVGWFGFYASPTPFVAAVPLILLGFALPMVHNTLQVNGTQMSPTARGAGMTLFAAALFIGQSLGIWAEARMADAWGTSSVVLLAAIGAPLLAFYVRARLGERPNAAPA